jgi:hypothetical protein
MPEPGNHVGIKQNNPLLRIPHTDDVSTTQIMSKIHLSFHAGGEGERNRN